ncbi:hypothetical protein JCM11251_001685 [Rhodosporidiobolus azoricus]
MPVTLLSTPPPSLDRDELSSISSSTPQTFEGIPPLLRHYEAEGVTIRVDPAHEGFTGEGVKGGLWVTEGALSFFSSSSSTGISIPYTHITLHAISRTSAPSSFTADTANGDSAAERPCVYVQFEQQEGAEESDDYDGSGSREMWITPKEAESVDKIFSTISYCCSLHPTTSSTAPPGVLSANGSSASATNGESSSHFNNPSAALYASMGLDPDSMVYAGADGELAGPGLAEMLAAEESGEGGEWDDAEEGGEEQQAAEGGRQRSDFVNPGRARGAPY